MNGIGDKNQEDGEFVCPSCGSAIGADSAECPICGESFTGGAAPASSPESSLAVPHVCEGCGKAVPSGSAKCEDCARTPAIKDRRKPEDDGPVCCPVCGCLRYTVETGDLVKCDECGNAYALPKPEPEGFFKGWKWKFWMGLTLILVGDFGFALASYIHNVLGWTFLGDMYDGYGWIDSALGILGIVLFAVGVLLFAWSFKREREVKCTSCGEFLLESELIPTEEPAIEPSEDSVQEALSKIEEELACPKCGKTVMMFDEKCESCGEILVALATEEKFESVDAADMPIVQTNGENENAREILDTIETLDGVGNGANGNGESIEKYIMADLEKIEAKEDISGDECPSCGIIAERGAKECPVCGASLNGGK